MSPATFDTRSRRGFWFIGIVVVAGAIAALVRWNMMPVSQGETSSDAAGDATEMVRHVRVAVAPAGSLASPKLFTRYRGDVRARRTSELAMQRTGRLMAILVHEGDVVTAGQPLAQLKTTDLDAAAAMSDAEVQSAEASLDEALAGPRYQTLRAAAEKVRQLEATLNAAEDRLEREVTLTRRGAGSEQSLEDAQYAVQRLRASVAEAVSNLDELQEGPRSERIAMSRAAVAMAMARREQVDVDREDSRIVAPYDAIISRRWVDEGVIVGPSQTVLSIVEIPPLEARIDLPADVADELTIGQTLELEIAGETTSATLVRMQPSVDPVMRTRTIDVQFDPRAVLGVPADDAMLATKETALIGQIATLRMPWDMSREVTAHEHEPGTEPPNPPFWIPSEALVRGVRGLWSVYVGVPVSANNTPMPKAINSLETVDHADAVIQRRDVQVLQTAGQMSLVAGMVRSGEMMVVRGTQRVGPNVSVELVVDAGDEWTSPADVAVAR